MNKQRRTELEKAIELLNQAQSIISTCQEEEQECFDNLNEGLQATERGQKFGENADSLQSAYDDIDSVIEYVNNAME